MAVTAIWAVKSNLAQVVDYAKNPAKTTNPKCNKEQTAAVEQEQWLSDVIHYATLINKTQIVVHDERTEIKQRFVTGINCLPETARSEMMATKKHYGKDDGIIAFHGYQSFAPGEATPDMAHEIGIKLAQELWGERFQVIVATHLDKANHLHNHFVINSVSFLDGYRYNDCTATYMKMRQASDALCREYSLSVIEEPKCGKSKHYSEWKTEQNNEPTYRSTVKADIDAAIRQSMTERQLWDSLKKQGWNIKFGKDITVRPPGKDRGLKLCRNFGEDYTIEAIRRRILEQTRPERIIIPPDPPPRKIRFKGNIHRARKITGLRALYFYYLYRMGVLPKKRRPNPKRVYFLFREDIRFIQNISRETRLLAKHGIETSEQLATHKDGLQSQINMLYSQRKHLRYKSRSIKDTDELVEVKAKIAALSEQIKELRREVRLCEDIEKRSAEMRDKIRRAAEDKKSQERELTKYEQFRGRR